MAAAAGSLTTSLFFSSGIFVTHRPLHADAAGGHCQRSDRRGDRHCRRWDGRRLVPSAFVHELLHRLKKSGPDSRHWRFYTGYSGVIGGPLTPFKVARTKCNNGV